MSENETHFDINPEGGTPNTDGTPIVPIEEIELTPERHNVLVGLLETRNEARSVGHYLVQQLLNGRRIIITGEPASGKSALFFQLLSAASENAARLGLPFDKKAGQYDFMLEMEKRRVERLGIKGKLEGEEFNERIYEGIMSSDIFEVPAVGEKDRVDRGRSAVERVERNMASGKDNKSLIVALYSSPLVQTYGEYIRTMILEAPIKKVFKLLDEYGMDIEGVERSRQNAKYVKDIFKLMANKDHIATIRQEVASEIADWHLNLQVQRLSLEDNSSPMDIIADRASGLQLVSTTPSDFRMLFSRFGIASSQQSELFFQKKAFDAQQDMANQAVYMEWRFRDMLGIDSDSAIVAGNSFAPNKTIYDFTPLLRSPSAA